MRWLTPVGICGALIVIGCGDDRCLPAGPSSAGFVEADASGGAGPSVTSGDKPIPPPAHPPIDTIPQMPMPTLDRSRGADSSNDPGAAVSVDLAAPVERAEPGCGAAMRRRSDR